MIEILAAIIGAIAGALATVLATAYFRRRSQLAKPSRKILSKYDTIDLESVLNQEGAYIRDRKKAFSIAGQMLLSESDNVLNVGATLSIEETQMPFFLKLEDAVNSRQNTHFTRIFTFESDESLLWTKWLLERLGKAQNFEMKMIKSGLSVPSCVITDSEAILGFNDYNSYVLSTAMYISRPIELIRDIREFYSFKYEEVKKRIVKVKAFKDEIALDDVEKHIQNIKSNKKPIIQSINGS